MGWLVAGHVDRWSHGPSQQSLLWPLTVVWSIRSASAIKFSGEIHDDQVCRPASHTSSNVWVLICSKVSGSLEGLCLVWFYCSRMDIYSQFGNCRRRRASSTETGESKPHGCYSKLCVSLTGAFVFREFTLNSLKYRLMSHQHDNSYTRYLTKFLSSCC